MKQKLLIFPFNGNGLEALDCIKDSYDFIGFIDDDANKQGKNELGFTVYSRDALKKNPEASVLAVPGSPLTFLERKTIISSLGISPERFATIIHPNATISPLAKIGYNVLIMAGVVITSNIIIGNHVFILPNTVIHHDSFIDEYTSIGSGVIIAGRTSVGKSCYIGSGTTIINDISIGDNTLIGMGANLIKKIPGNSKVVGNPARLI